MDNELITKKSWWRKNWKWFLPLSGFLGVIFIAFLLSINGLTDFAQTYADTSLCQNAVNEANKNEQVIESLGKLQPVDNIAILEGNSVYTNNNKNASITVRVNGEKENAKMDIVAEKSGNVWSYKLIRIRIKKTGKEIVVLNK